MFDIDGIFNNIIFLIPVAIIATRLIGRARAKKAPPPKKPPQPYIPVHFEDDSDDDLVYFKNRAETAEKTPSQAIPKRTTQKIVSAPFTPKPDLLFSADTLLPSAPIKTVGVAPLRQNNFTFNLNHLSPLKQAVVMAEILGQPKGML